MKNVLVFVALVVAAVLVPLVLAAALTAVAGIGPVELTILYVACISGAVLTWRSFRRRNAVATS